MAIVNNQDELRAAITAQDSAVTNMLVGTIDGNSSGQFGGGAYPVLSKADADAFINPRDGFEGWEIRLSDDRTQITLARIMHTITYLNTKGAYNPNLTTFIGTSPDIVLQPLTGPQGYQFVGWFTEAEGGAPVTVIPTGTSEDITLYAHWDIIIPWRVLTFDPNDAGGPPAENIPLPIQVVNADEVWLPSGIPARKGYSFAGWNSAADGEGIMYRPGQYLGLLTTDTVLYAIWQPNSSSCCCCKRCCGKIKAR